VSHDEEERERFFELASGVKQDAFGQFWRYSSYASGSIPGWHPAMLGRRRGTPPSLRQDLISGAIFLAIVFGIPAVAIFTPSGYKLVAGISYATSVTMWVLLALAVARVRSRRAKIHPHKFPHPGPKGHHQHH
jgi:hypothetical protein